MSRAPSRVFISGASSGLGEALALHYSARGAALGLVARREDALRGLASRIPGPAETYPLDVRDAPALAIAAQSFIRRFGVPDLVIANAGISSGTLTEVAEDLPVFQAILDTNVMGMVHTFHPFVAAMRMQGGGALVGVASVAGFRGLPGAGAYCASKAAALAYLESLRVELRASRVRVVSVCPGYIRTPMTAGNPYPMPFILDADTAAAGMARAIERGRSLVVLPWQMAAVGRLLRLLPNPVYDALFAKAPRKPRQTPG